MYAKFSSDSAMPTVWMVRRRLAREAPRVQSGVREEAEHPAREDEVERAGRKLRVLDPRPDRTYLLETACLRLACAVLDPRLGLIERDDHALRADPFGEIERDEARPAADVEAAPPARDADPLEEGTRDAAPDLVLEAQALELLRVRAEGIAGHRGA